MKVSSQAIGIEAAAVINNGGKGMIELESDSYTMNEDETKDLKIKRVGGTEGKLLQNCSQIQEQQFRMTMIRN